MVDKICATPALQLADVFPPFVWTFGKVRRFAGRDSPSARQVASTAAHENRTPLFSHFQSAYCFFHPKINLDDD
jgi:hypothetical protein